MRPISAFSEGQIVTSWLEMVSRNDLVTEEGEPVRVIYPGRSNHDQGPDFLDAVIATGKGLITGDIEVHVRSSGWWLHRHQRDARYQRLILHVVFWRDTEAAADLQDGTRVPTLVLSKYIKMPACRRPKPANRPGGYGIPCAKAAWRRDIAATGKVLDSAGDERFSLKAAEFQEDMMQAAPGQSLYQGIMGALGYAKNKSPFVELARRVPLHMLESVVRGRASEEECLATQQALLLGSAGLLPSQGSGWRQAYKGDGWVSKLEKLWASSGQTAVMSEDDWHFCKVRPGNYPPRRIAAVSYLMLRYGDRGLLQGIAARLGEAPADSGRRALENMLTVGAGGYWAVHFDLGPAGRLMTSALVGGSRAGDIIVNVVLPFVFAWGKFTSRPRLARKALEFYHQYPKVQSNTVERHMVRQLGISSGRVNSARQQQGLLHIYRTLCSQGRCDCCGMVGHTGSVDSGEARGSQKFGRGFLCAGNP